MNHTTLEDKLRRILHMEETIAAQLLALLDCETAPPGVAPPIWTQIHRMLERIADDTNRHAQTVGRMLAAEAAGRHT